MPALPPVPSVLKVVHTGTIAGEPWAGVSHWRFVTPGGLDLTSDNVRVICAKFVNSWRDNIKPYTAAQCIDTQVEGTDLTSVLSATGVAADGDAGDGDEIISPEACILVGKTVGRRYRGGHPRTYWPGLTRGLALQYHGRALGDAYVGAVSAAFLAYYDDIPPAVTTDGTSGCSSFHEVSVSYYHSGAVRSVPVVDDIVGRHLEVPLATQRRRMHRR